MIFCVTQKTIFFLKNFFLKKSLKFEQTLKNTNKKITSKEKKRTNNKQIKSKAKLKFYAT